MPEQTANAAMEVYGISFQGAMVAGTAGAMLGLGNSLLSADDNAENGRYIARRSAGGAVFCLGLYLFSPKWLRGT